MEKRPSARSTVRQQNLEKIRAAVDQLIEEVGFENMTVRQVCQRAGVVNGTFYYNFKSKDDLIRDRYFRSHEYFQRLYQEKLSKLTALDALKVLVSEYEKYLAAWAIPTLSCYLKASLAESVKWNETEKHAFLVVSRTLFEQGQAEGTIRKDYTPEQLTNILYCTVMGITYMHCSTNGAILADGSIYRQLAEWLESLRAT